MVEGIVVQQVLLNNKRVMKEQLGFAADFSSSSSHHNLDLYAAFVPPRRFLRKRQCIRPSSSPTSSPPTLPSLPQNSGNHLLVVNTNKNNNTELVSSRAAPNDWREQVVLDQQTMRATTTTPSVSFETSNSVSSPSRSKPHRNSKQEKPPPPPPPPSSSPEKQLMRRLVACMKHTERSRSKLFLHRQSFSKEILELSDKVLHRNTTRKKLIWMFEEKLGDIPSYKDEGTSNSVAATATGDDDEDDDDDDDDYDGLYDYDEGKEAKLREEEESHCTPSITLDKRHKAIVVDAAAAAVSPYTSPQTQRTSVSPKLSPVLPSYSSKPSSPSCSSAASVHGSMLVQNSPNRSSSVKRSVFQNSPDRSSASASSATRASISSRGTPGVPHVTTAPRASSPSREQQQTCCGDSCSTSPGRVSCASEHLAPGKDCNSKSSVHNPSPPRGQDDEVPLSIVKATSI